jgi:hypothetical protein
LQAADHVKGLLGLAPQRHFQKIILDARLNGLADFTGHFKETVGGTQPFDALVGTFVVVILNPESDPFAGRFEGFKLRPAQELLIERGPEALDFPQRHRVMRGRANVMDVFLLQLLLEPGFSPPRGVLPAIVGEHLTGRLVSGDGATEHLQNILGRLAVEQPGAGDEPGIVIHDSNEIDPALSHLEGEDVALPHLVGRGPLEEPGTDQVAPGLGRTFN